MMSLMACTKRDFLKGWCLNSGYQIYQIDSNWFKLIILDAKFEMSGRNGQASFPDPAHWGPYQSPRAWHGELPKQDAAAVARATWNSCQKGRKDASWYITSMHLSNLRLSMFILHHYDSICLDQVYRTYRISCRVKGRLWVCSEFATATWFVLIQDFGSCNEFDSSLHPMSASNTNNIIW